MSAEFKAEWPTGPRLASAVPLPVGYVAEVLRADEVGAALRFVDDSFPGLALSNASCHLRREFYETRVALDGVAAVAGDRDSFVLTIKRGAEWAALLAVERDADSQVLYGRIGTVAPAHRRARIGACFPALMVEMGRAMGLGMVYSLATLKTPAMQRAFEQAGWQLIGIMPGFDREVVAPGVVRRVYEAIYVRVLAPPEDILPPSQEGMRPATLALFERLFGGNAGTADC